MELDEALRQISEIRQQMARSEVFRGYRAATVALSGIAGIVAAALQPHWAPEPELALGRYLALWIGAAAISVAAAAAEIAWRAWRAGPGLMRRHTLLAAEQSLPTAVVGALITAIIYTLAPEIAWTLPGLWSLLFALGIFASARLLPRPALFVAGFYILAGCAALIWGRGEHALSPWTMAVSFGAGQLLAAAILYWTLERTDGPQTRE